MKQITIRMMPGTTAAGGRALALVAGAIVLSSCGTSGGASSTATSGVQSFSASIPAACPSTPAPVPINTTPPQASSHLVPGDATVAYVCVYPGPQESQKATGVPIVVTDVAGLLRALNIAEDATTKSYSCPPDQGGIDTIVLEGQPGPVVTVALPRSGCMHVASTYTTGIWALPYEAQVYVKTIDPSYPA